MSEVGGGLYICKTSLNLCHVTKMSGDQTGLSINSLLWAVLRTVSNNNNTVLPLVFIYKLQCIQ